MKNSIFIIVIAFFTIISCKKVVDNVDTKNSYFYHNQTSHDLEITFFINSDIQDIIFIKKNSNKTIDGDTQDGTLGPMGWITNSRLVDSAVIKFDDNKILKFSRFNSPTSKSIIKEDGYETAKISDLEYVYHYYITQNHYDLAF